MEENKTQEFITFVIIVLSIILVVLAIVFSVTRDANTVYHAKFKGYLKDGEEVTEKSDVFAPDSKVYTFSVSGGGVVSYKIANKDDSLFKNPTAITAEDGAFEIQNQLKIDEIYNLTVSGDTIVGVEAVNKSQSVSNGVVSYTPGERTLKNFLKTSLAPLGETLIVYGGGWDLQDVGAGNEARTIGVDAAWKKEFESQTVDYDWLKVYPHYGWNKDHSRGLDNCGYVGWALYNSMYSTSLDHDGLVFHPEVLSQNLTQKYNYGTDMLADLKGKNATEIADKLQPGDIIGSFLHSRIVIGVCEDKSVVLADCCSAISKTGAEGGGVQLIALNTRTDGDKYCDAYRLVRKYMLEVCPAWSERYDPAMKTTYVCFDLVAATRMNLKTGIFSDPDGYADKTADEILADIFSSK